MNKKKILIVDDEDDILHFLELVLREKGYEVATASGGHEALTKAQLERPDLVLLDIMMPQMDGWEVLELLRVDEGTSHIPVAMLSARTEAKDRVQGLQEGAIDYICKPFSLQELLGKIETIFSQVEDGGQRRQLGIGVEDVVLEAQPLGAEAEVVVFAGWRGHGRSLSRAGRRPHRAARPRSSTCEKMVSIFPSSS